MLAHRYAMWVVAMAVLVGGWAVLHATGSPLIDAVKRGDNQEVASLLKKGADVNQRDVQNATALHWAAHLNNAGLVSDLLAAGAKASVTNEFGVTPLALAAENGSEVVLTSLLRAGADPNSTSQGGETALMLAARANNPAAVRVLLKNGADPNAREHTRSQTALMWAAAGGNTAVIESLVEARADVNARSSELKAFHDGTYLAGSKAASRDRVEMFTPLLFAVRNGHIEAARALLAAGANVNDQTADGTSALHVACINGHWELGVMLVDEGADVRAESPGGTALHHIARTHSAEILVRVGGSPPPEDHGKIGAMDLVRKIVAAGADVNARITKPMAQLYGSSRGAQVGTTPLLMTAIPANPEYMRVLLELGADPKVTTVNHTTLLMMAAGLGLSSMLGDDEEALAIVKTAIERGVDVNAKNDDGDTALHGAAFRNSVPLVKYLVEHGADVEARNSVGWTPLMEAHWTARGNLTTRPETESYLREVYEARGIAQTVTSREEAIEKLLYSKGGPRISCPASQTVQSKDGSAVKIDYPMAVASSRLIYDKITVRCTPTTGSDFPLGTTTVTCEAIDSNNRKDECAVLMRVVQ